MAVNPRSKSVVSATRISSSDVAVAVLIPIRTYQRTNRLHLSFRVGPLRVPINEFAEEGSHAYVYVVADAANH